MNVSFKRGPQQQLDNLQSYVEGSFYLTSDTDRLYFAQSSNELILLNNTIHKYTGSTLPSSTAQNPLTDGDFYYWTNNNILMVYNVDPSDGTGSWTQVNPDTKVSSFTTTVSDTGSSGTEQVTIIGQIGQSRADGATIGTVTNSTAPINIVAGSNIHLTVDPNSSGHTFIISADNDTTNTTYDLATVTNSTGGTIRLAGSNSTNDDVVISGVGDVNVTSDASGAITITSQDPIDSINNSINTTNGQFTTTLAFDHSNGHSAATANKTSTAIVPTVQYGSVATEDPTTHEVSVSYANSAIFNNTTSGGAPAINLDVYSRSQIDTMLENQFSGFDAMQYKGTVSSSDASVKLNPSTAQAGDTYKASSDINLTGTLTLSAKTGDLIIASGSDDNVTWEVVPSGDEQIVTMTTTAASNLVQFTDTKPSTPANIGGILIHGESTPNDTKAHINVTTTVNSVGNIAQFELVHGAAGAGTAETWTAVDSNSTVQSAGNTIDIPTITGISRDQNGHISSVTTATYRVVDTHASLEAISVSYNDSNNVGTATLTTKLDTDSQMRSASIAITSSSLVIDSTASNLTINLEWGTF